MERWDRPARPRIAILGGARLGKKLRNTHIVQENVKISLCPIVNAKTLRRRNLTRRWSRVATRDHQGTLVSRLLRLPALSCEAGAAKVLINTGLFPSVRRLVDRRDAG